ncbi:MAG: hypothetical protein IIV95_06565 [Burkholderiaceae bacterium]|nr:hypothetical protein [Burkholderiaceae bacterium]MBR2961046.1 hypothetical protein [Burkholderiaceae bacterium]
MTFSMTIMMMTLSMTLAVMGFVASARCQRHPAKAFARPCPMHRSLERCSVE